MHKVNLTHLLFLYVMLNIRQKKAKPIRMMPTNPKTLEMILFIPTISSPGTPSYGTPSRDIKDVLLTFLLVQSFGNNNDVFLNIDFIVKQLANTLNYHRTLIKILSVYRDGLTGI